MSKDFLRIGIPKTASVSIESSGLIKEKNKTIRPILARDIKNIKDFFSFAIVRNPYEKVLSTYFYWTKVGNSRNSGSDSFYKFTKKYPTFESFIMDYDNSEALEIYQSSKYTQWKFITDIDDNIIIDFVGRFDNLEEDFKKIQLINGTKEKNLLTLPHLNKSKHDFWKTYYNDEMAEIIYEKWKDDFVNLNFDKYSFKN
jgi:chondroitin 4-sulfotransferase 11